ncbi:beta-L-arabinofuranosidase domain-containing protein [Leifsonia sp. NPDC058230]|uniref:beta-L-arabinofuranosidase domain-containing protein n=1 Tax=Leifsonia sp. NPDC058230 TaxID=3346391 RepID=UPI0036D8FB5D
MSRVDPLITVLEHSSFLGSRYEGNVKRLLDVDLEPLLDGFRSKPGIHPWIGEHIGKWLDAASLVVATTGNELLDAKLRFAAHELMDAQEDDGYLGTYPTDKRFGMYEGADWDVWANKYSMIGLLAYYRATGDEAALRSASRVGDLLMRTFHDPGDKDILKAGTHMGMAATSVLQPIVELYSLTAESRFLAFARGIIHSWDRPAGPKVMSTLLRSGRVNEVGNGKAYEMLSNLVGLADYAAATNETDPLLAVTRAWDDIVQNHLYLTGSMSYGEHFHEPGKYPDSTSVNMGETCVTVTWIQLTARLFTMTGEARFAAELERTYFNHLAAAQSPDGSAWCYYTPLAGAHDYGSGISCCISSGPRGVALLPQTVFALDGNELVVAQYVPGATDFEIAGRRMTASLQTGMPFEGGATLSITAEDGNPVELAVRWRVPAWATDFTGPDISDVAHGWAATGPRVFDPGAETSAEFQVGLRTVDGDGSNLGRVAYLWGPLVLSYPSDASAPSVFDVSIDAPEGTLSIDRPIVEWRIANRFSPEGSRSTEIGPFGLMTSLAGESRVWIATAEPFVPVSAFQGANETRSSGDLSRGSVTDYDFTSFAETADTPVESDVWFALEQANPVAFDRVLIAHGRSLVHGGWFDTTKTKPRIEIKETPESPWVHLAEIAGYPAADAVWDAGLLPGQLFELVLSKRVNAAGIRVIGRGSYGEYPRSTRFATCARLAAFVD